jgi:hypothetical protein
MKVYESYTTTVKVVQKANFLVLYCIVLIKLFLFIKIALLVFYNENSISLQQEQKILL